MTSLKLSILIPSTPDRKSAVANLLEQIKTQLKHFEYVESEFDENGLKYTMINFGDLVEVLIGEDDRVMTIGEKRERMYKMAKGTYSWQYDSDDEIMEGGIQEVLNAMSTNPDCITFEEYVNIDGREYKSNHSLIYQDWEGDGNNLFPDGYHFHRTPFMKNVIKTEIAQSVPVPHIRFGEDHQWSKAIYSLLKTESHIQLPIYRYIHVSSPHTERYGFDKD